MCPPDDPRRGTTVEVVDPERETDDAGARVATAPDVEVDIDLGALERGALERAALERAALERAASEVRSAAPPVDPRIEARRIAVEQEQGRQRLRLLVLALGAFVVLGSLWLLVQSPLLDVDRVVVTGVPSGRVAAVAAASGVHRHDPILFVSSGSVARRIEHGVPGIGSVVVTRQFPGTVRIAVHEQGVALYVRTTAGVALVSHDGRVTGHADTPPVGVPELIGAGRHPVVGRHVGPAGVAEVMEELPPALRARVGAINVATAGHVRLYLVGAGEVRLGDLEDVHDKGAAAEAVIESFPPGCQWAYIDVEARSAPVAKPGPGCASS